jgi:hypothetical protein
MNGMAKPKQKNKPEETVNDVNETQENKVEFVLAKKDEADDDYAGMLRQGWIALAFWMSFGLWLEGLLGYKVPAYLSDPTRRELFRLAHTHGAVLALVLIAAAICFRQRLIQTQNFVEWVLRIGTVLMPTGFLLAGIWHYEGDPGLAIWLVPPSALLIIFGIVCIVLSVNSGKKNVR